MSSDNMWRGGGGVWECVCLYVCVCVSMCVRACVFVSVHVNESGEGCTRALVNTFEDANLLFPLTHTSL